MDLFEKFIDKLECEEHFNLRDIRLLNVERQLKKEIGKTTLTKYCRDNKINKGTLYYMLKGKRAVYFDLVNLRNKDKIKLLLKNSNIEIKIPEKVTKELAYLVGVLRDGSVIKESNEYTVAFYSKYKESLFIVKNYLKKLFDLDNEIENNKHDLYMIRIRSKTLYLFFKLLFEVKQKQENWNTPKLIKESEDGVKKSYIRGFWDAEGGCPHLENINKIVKKNLEVKFSQKNKESLDFIRNYLNFINIRTGNVYWNKDCYVLKITQSNIHKFHDLIGSSHPVKAKRLRILIKLFAH